MPARWKRPCSMRLLSRTALHPIAGGKSAIAATATTSRRTRRSVPLKIRVAAEARLVGAQERARLLEGHALGPDGLLGRASYAGDEVLGLVAHVLEHRGHRVPGHDVVDLVAALAERDDDGVGVAEEVVQVAQDLLVGADEEDAEVVVLVLERVELDDVLDVPPIDEVVDLAVGVAGDVGEHGATRRLLVEAVDRQDG